MSADFTSVRNHNERAVYEAVGRHAHRYPGLGNNGELLADVACVALNRLPPRYIRHEVDYVFYLSERERSESERQQTRQRDQPSPRRHVTTPPNASLPDR